MQIHLRSAEEEDCKLLFQWANDPVTRTASFSSDPIAWERHVAWFAKKLTDPQCLFFIGLNEEEKPVGPVRFDCEGDHATVSMSICPTCRGKGYGTALVQAACNKFFESTDVAVVDAYIKQDNAGSIRLFEKAGFQKAGTMDYAGHPAAHFILKRST